MAKFTKYSNPNRHKKYKPETEYQKEMRESYYREIAKRTSDAERELIKRAYHATKNGG